MAPHRSPRQPNFAKALAVAAVIIAAAGLVVVEGEKVTFINKCPHVINLVDSQSKTTPTSIGSNATAAITPGQNFSGEYSVGGAHTFYHGNDTQATLAELHFPANAPQKVWYGISIIPPGAGDCKTYVDCKQLTGRKGFNVPMAIKPQTPTSNEDCRELVCLADDPVLCKDASHFPGDQKTHACPQGTALDVIFCPAAGGKSGGGNIGGNAPAQQGPMETTPPVLTNAMPSPSPASPSSPPPVDGLAPNAAVGIVKPAGV